MFACELILDSLDRPLQAWTVPMECATDGYWIPHALICFSASLYLLEFLLVICNFMPSQLILKNHYQEIAQITSHASTCTISIDIGCLRSSNPNAVRSCAVLLLNWQSLQLPPFKFKVKHKGSNLHRNVKRIQPPSC